MWEFKYRNYIKPQENYYTPTPYNRYNLLFGAYLYDINENVSKPKLIELIKENSGRRLNFVCIRKGAKQTDIECPLYF